MKRRAKRAKPSPRLRAVQDSDSDSDDEDDNEVVRQGRDVYFYASVSPASTLKLAKLLDDASREAVNADAPHVTLHIHSWGGCVFAGLAAFDQIRTNRVPVHTVACGFVASAATLLLLAGHRRFCHPNSAILIHQLSTGCDGKLHDILEEVRNSQVTMGMMHRVYEENTWLTSEQLNVMLRGETMLTYEKACEHGFVEGPYAPAQIRRAPPHAAGRGRADAASQTPCNTHLRWKD